MKYLFAIMILATFIYITTKLIEFFLIAIESDAVQNTITYYDDY